MPLSRDERIEELYNESAWDLAEAVVDLEDELLELRKRHSLTVDNLINVAEQRSDLVDRVGELEAELEDTDFTTESLEDNVAVLEEEVERLRHELLKDRH